MHCSRCDAYWYDMALFGASMNEPPYVGCPQTACPFEAELRAAYVLGQSAAGPVWGIPRDAKEPA